jgi:ankyrin repeat protein
MKQIRVPVVCVFTLGMVCALAQDASDGFYQALRNNDIAALQRLLKTADVNVKDQRETTPLMYAAAYGSIDAMKLLLDSGAGVNAKNAFAATPLLWCANDIGKIRLLIGKGADVNARSKQGMTPLLAAASDDGAPEVVKLLLEKGADPAVRGPFETTALLAATGANNTASVSLLLQKGVDVNAKDLSGETPLMNAASYGNVEVMKMLLAKCADVNANGAGEFQQVKNGPIALGLFTPLLTAAAYGGPDAVKLLLDAGAKVNVQDVRGMTPLMFAVASDQADARVVRLLLSKGADTNIKSKNGETAVDWAKKFAHAPVLEALGIGQKQLAAAPFLRPVGEAKEAKTVGPKEAAGKSIVLLQRTSAGFFTEGGCVSCHAQNLTGAAVGVARANGIPVDERAAAEQLKTVKLQWAAFEQVLLQRIDPPGAGDAIMYSIFHLAAEGAKPDHTIDALIHNLAGEQHKEGNWHIPAVARPPLEDGDFSRTSISIRALSVYELPGRKAEFNQRIQRAAAWLQATTPRTTEDRDMQLLGLKWAHTNRRTLEDPLKELIALQRPDGGWAQTLELASDAYATGQVLYTMHELGVPASDAAYRHGVTYLLKTQLPDGSWRVTGRSPKFHSFFQSSFPDDYDQWFSSSATAWAAMALTYAAAEKPLTAER